MSDAKLRRLREWIRSHVSYPLPDSPAGQLSIESILFKIDRLLAEPEPQCAHEFRMTLACGERFLRCWRCGSYGDPPPRRESLEQEIRRLFDHSEGA